MVPELSMATADLLVIVVVAALVLMRTAWMAVAQELLAQLAL